MKRHGRRGPPRALETRSAGAAIADVLQLRGISDDIRARRVIVEWSELVGPRIAQRTRPDRIDERVLIVEVASSAWLHELNLLRPQILEGLLARIGEPWLFDDLKLRLAGRSRREPIVAPRPRAPGPAKRAPSTPATGAAREAIVRETSQIDDNELRELIARVRITHGR